MPRKTQRGLPIPKILNCLLTASKDAFHENLIALQVHRLAKKLSTGIMIVKKLDVADRHNSHGLRLFYFHGLHDAIVKSEYVAKCPIICKNGFCTSAAERELHLQDRWNDIQRDFAPIGLLLG